ncbi:19240_t:CDS:2, partial [Racocetra persica]
MARKDKKNGTCEHCRHPCTILQKLCEYLNRKNPCRPFISPVLLPQHQRTLTISRNPKVLDIAEIKLLNNGAQDYEKDEKAYDNIELTKQTKEEQEFFGEPEIERQVIDSSKAGPGPKTQAHQEGKNEQSRKISLKIDQTDKEFECLSMITGDNKKSIIFREQNMGPALKRRAVAVYNAKVSRYHQDNGSNIRKMLESQRKLFRELLEKEFDKRGQFKFSLCSLTKFLIDDKPGDKEKDKKKNSRTDWLQNKQIIRKEEASLMLKN